MECFAYILVFGWELEFVTVSVINWLQEWTIDMTGQVCPTKRACFWKTKRVFFVTPQVLEKDIQSGNIPSNAITLLTAKRLHLKYFTWKLCEHKMVMICEFFEWKRILLRKMEDFVFFFSYRICENICPAIPSYTCIVFLSFIPSIVLSHGANFRNMSGKTLGLFGNWWGS